MSRIDPGPRDLDRLVALKLLAPSAATADELTTWRGWGQIGLGLLVLLVGLLQFRRRPAPGAGVYELDPLTGDYLETSHYAQRSER